MTASPGRVKQVVRVPFAHPRSKSSADLSSFTAHLHDQIKQEVDKVAANELDADWKQDSESARTEADIYLGEGI
jgi:hypothetical protein